MTAKRIIYLDNNSTTPCAPEVVAEMTPYFSETFGNAASSHSYGRMASSAVARARQEIASAVGADATEIIFTSGATEANNLALFGMAQATSRRRKIVVSAVEHKSVLIPANKLAEDGFRVEWLPVDKNGKVATEVAEQIIDTDTIAVSLQAANNETGVIQPVKEIAEIAHSVGAVCHCDAAQAIGKMMVNIDGLGVDLASFSAHKAYGPKGIGALFVSAKRSRPPLRPQLWGGGQEGHLRAGTLNVPGIVGFGAACRLVADLLRDDTMRISHLRSLCEEALLQSIARAQINSREAIRLPGTISLTIPGIPADMLMANLPTVCIGDGAACSSGVPEASHVLIAMSLSRQDAECTVRISLGRYTTEIDVRTAVEELSLAVQHLLEEMQEHKSAE
jgi:cysteine desulfurase